MPNSANPPLEIREAEPTDWPAIAQLLDRPPAHGPNLHRWTLSEYSPPITLVALLNNELIGAAVGGLPRSSSAGPDAPETPARLNFIGITPRHRRQGHARALLDSFFAELRTYHVRRFSVVVEGTQIEALAFFRAADFEADEQTLGLLRPAARLPLPSRAPAHIRALALDDLPLLTGLLIRLGMERATEPHDSLEALTPASLEAWLQRTGTVAYAAWDPADPSTPVGLTWATRRADDAVLRFVGVDDERRRTGIGTSLLASVVDMIDDRPLRTTLTAPGEEADFFRATGFQVERVTHTMSRTLT